MDFSLNILTKSFNFITALVFVIGVNLYKYFFELPKNVFGMSITFIYYIALSVCLVNIIIFFIKKITMRLGEKKRVKAIQKEQNNKKESVKNFYRSKLGDFLPSDLQFLKDLYELNKHRTNYNC